MLKSFLIKIFIVILIFSTTKYTFPKNVSKTEIRNVVQNFLRYKSLTGSQTLTKQTIYNISKIEPLHDPSENSLLAYIVKLKPRGFLIASSDTKSEPIIAYSFRHHWNSDTSQYNIFYHLLLKDMRLQKNMSSEPAPNIMEEKILNWQEELTVKRIATSNFYQWPEPGKTITGGWIETTWSQKSPYNYFCPLDPTDGKRCPVGCLAVAMAQIINYHKHVTTQGLTIDDRYTTRIRKIQIDEDNIRCNFPNFRALNDNLKQIQNKYDNLIGIEQEEIATLNFFSGILLNMDYTSSSSGASLGNIIPALKEKIGYVSADKMDVSKNFYRTLIENVINGLPAVLAFKSHALITDGYNTDGYFHFNFGYGSNQQSSISDAWYLPSQITQRWNPIVRGVVNIRPFSIKSTIHLLASHRTIYLQDALINESSQIEQVRLKNIGESTINIDKILTSAQFLISLTGDEFINSLGPVTLQPGEELRLYVKCIPQRPNHITGKIQVFASNSNIKTFLAIDMVGFGRPKNAIKQYVVHQNYPNPFNVSTKIKFSLPKPKVVTIEVYNIIGQKIETLLSKFMPKGHHEIEFNGKNLSSGVYLYRIDIGGPSSWVNRWQDVKKMVLLR